MKRVLIVWQEIPEDTWLYDLEVTEDVADRIAEAHNCYVNGESDESSDLANYVMELVEGKPRIESRHKGTFDLIVLTGFIL